MMISMEIADSADLSTCLSVGCLALEKDALYLLDSLILLSYMGSVQALTLRLQRAPLQHGLFVVLDVLEFAVTFVILFKFGIADEV